MARITGAYNRRKRKTKKPVTGSKGRANRSKVSTAKVTSEKTPITKGKAKVTGGQKALPPGKKGGALTTKGGSLKTKGGELGPRAKGPRGMRPRLPAGTKGGALVKRGVSAMKGRLGLAGLAIGAGAAIGRYMQKNVKKNTAGSGRGAGRQAFGGSKPAPKPAAKSSKTPMKKSPGIAKGAAAAVKKGAAAANSNKSKLSPKQKTIAKKSGNPNKIEGSDLKALRSKPKAAKKPAAKPSTPQSRAYAKDARNREYDRLRRSGKIKEAVALGKKIHQDTFGKKKKK